MFNAHDSESNDEIESIYTGETLDRAAVQRLLEYLRSSSARRQQGTQVTITTTLDVSVQVSTRLGLVRLTVVGDDEIKRALKGEWDSATVMHKKRLRPSVEIPEHRCRVNFKREEPVRDKTETRAAHASAASGDRQVYRLKRRFSFPSADNQFKYDVTAVRQLNQSAPTWENLNSIPEKYEVECEFVGKAEKSASVTSTLLKCFGTLLKVLDDTDILMTITQRDAVLFEFLSLVFPRDKTVWTTQVAAGQVQPTFLPGPKPVTLEYHHITSQGTPARSRKAEPMCDDDIQRDQPGTVSAVGGIPYTVTEKADGEHRVLFVSNSGKAYTLAVEGVVKVRDTGLSCKPGGRGSRSVLDGEYITETPTTGSLFASYDAFFFEGQDVRRLHLMREEENLKSDKVASKEKKEGRSRLPASSRLSACRMVASSLDGSLSSTLRVLTKSFTWYRGDYSGLTEAVKKVITRRNAGNFPYEIDGVILTPAEWPMGATSSEGAAKSEGTWHATLKWKPPDQNSIDFLVRVLPREIVRREGISYKVAHLYVGYNPAKWDPVTTLALLTDAASPSARRAAGAYIEHLFGIPGERGDLHVCHIPMTEDERLVCRNGDDVIDATVVEFTYDMTLDTNLPASFKWVPLRPRPDKTQRYVASGGKIGGAANDISSALSVWMSIINPVTEDIICGMVSPDPVVSEVPNAYYTSKLRFGDGGMSSMRDFHHWVKSTDLLLRLKGSSTRSLFDIGCGRGGDLHSWIKLGVTRVLGVDLYSAGIVDPDNGANVRIMEMKKKSRGQAFPRIVLLPMDASKLLDAEQIDAMDADSGDRKVAQVVWSLVDVSSVTDDRLRRFHGFATGGFDVVSCQFAIHYFFSTPDTLRAFAYNVSRHIRRGGCFVGTCMDAHRVNEAFGTKRCIHGVGDGKIIWRIQRVYDKFDTNADCKGNTGLRVKVYVQSIGQVIEEFLVDYRLLKLAMREVGLVPPNTQQLKDLGLDEKEAEGGTSLFDASFRRMTREHDKDKRVSSAMKMTDDEKSFSFMNRWFIFVKTNDVTQ